MDLESTSKMNEKQFLALRTLWTSNRRSNFGPPKWGITKVPEAQALLKNVPSWTAYLDNVLLNDSNPIPIIPENIGTFSLVSYYQQMTQQTEGTERGEPNPGPSVKTRSTIAQPTTPKKMNVREMFETMGLGGDSDEQSSAEKSAKSEPFSDELEQLMYPKVDDEQIVNASLIIFFNALAFHFKDMNGQWSMRRKAFNFGTQKGSGKPLFQARTDGHLWMRQRGAAVSKAIVEVKPYRRVDYEDAVKRQETGEMACWIYAEPRSQDGSETYR